MRRLAVLILLTATAACGGSSKESTEGAAPAAAPSAAPAAKAVSAGWVTSDGIKTPESVYYDSASGFVYSSQIDGAPDGRDGNGRIVKLNGDGSVVNASFITGLNAPKGLRACDGTLWAADLDEVIAVDLSTGTVKSRTKIADAKFLNDVACAGSTAYVTDMLGNKIYAVKDGAASVAAEGDLEFPNGLLVDGDRLIVGGWGSAPKADFSTDVPGHLYAYDLKSKQKTLITPKPTANIDGLESDGKGGYLITDYNAGKLLHVSASGEAKLVRQFKPGTADIAFLADRGIVLIPHMNENQVGAYDISAELK
jgi:sugar lactone lactonase YvrE